MKKVLVGSKVKLRFDDGCVTDFTLVNPNDADILDKKVSSDSPVGYAIKGKNEGENTKYFGPKNNLISCKIIEVI